VLSFGVILRVPLRTAQLDILRTEDSELGVITNVPSGPMAKLPKEEEGEREARR